MSVEISVLGDIKARIDGHDVDLGHVRRQSEFVALLADVNRLVPVDRLIDRVWGRRPPPEGARSSLYSYVSRLRSATSAAGGDVVVNRRPGGYVLSLNDDTLDAVDLHRFRELTSRAQDPTAADDSLPLLEEALALWRADAFGALDSPWVNEFRESLRLERFRAELDRNDLLIHRGRQAERLGDLLSLSQVHPLDERLLGQLMLTLYREGRTAQALEHYDRTRRALAEELGTDPGAELRDLHLKILHADPALTPPVSESVPSTVRQSSANPLPVPLPSQLPSPPPLLAGRGQELAALDTVWDTGSTPVTVVCGLGGVGKTSLALRWAHDNLGRFPDGQLYVNLHGFSPSTSATKPQTAVHDFLIALGMDKKAIPTSAEAQIGLYRSLLVGRRMLILLDNARDAEQVRDLIPGSPTCVVLITSRNRLSGLVATEGARSVALGPLTPVEAHRLLAARAGERRVAAEPEAAESIITGCGRFPLALAIAVARATGDGHLPRSELAAELREAETRLDALETGDLDTSLRGVLDASHRALPAPAARLLSLLGVLPGQDIGLTAVAALAGLTASRTRALLRTLEAAHLVQQPDRVEGFLAEGASLVLYRVQEFHPAIRRICRLLQSRTGRLAEAVAFLSPPGQGALSLHQDKVDVIVLQTSGTKRWRIFGHFEGQDEPGLVTVPEGVQPAHRLTLTPGDTCYMPAGRPHQALSGDDWSLHISVTAWPVEPAQALASNLNRVLSDLPKTDLHTRWDGGSPTRRPWSTRRTRRRAMKEAPREWRLPPSQAHAAQDRLAGLLGLA